MGEKSIHDNFMKTALSLAKRGRGKVNPNPMVGAVVVKNGKILGKGHHPFFGGPHAEVRALEQSGKNSRGAEMYVTLEPCSHFGKTPPCTESIRAAGISKVYVAAKDPNPLVNGKGIADLAGKGIEVALGLCEDEAIELNRVFFKFMETKEVFVSLKMALTADGFIADRRGKSKWITSEKSRNYAHILRACHDAVLVGIDTVRKDNPSLNVRLQGRYRQPLRVVIDPRLVVSPGSRLFAEEGGDVVIFTSRVGGKKRPFGSAKYQPHIVEIESIRRRIPVSEILRSLSKMGVTSLIVEGGAGVFSAFIAEGIVDRLYIFVAGKFFGTGLSPLSDVSGLAADAPFSIHIEKVRRIEEDILIEAIPVKRDR